MTELIYQKYGTRIAAPDEGDEGIQRFAFEGCQAMLADGPWEILPGPVERVSVGVYDEDEIFAYLWPIAREAPS